VDKTDRSYYGTTMMYCILTKGNSFKVDLDKSGPMYSFEWAPNSAQFCICFGYMPSKVVVFNLKGDVVWNLGEGHRNEVHYNRFGNILATCGFGNLSAGKMQFWNVEKRSEIVQMEVANTTHFEWAPDGQHFVTATTAPRLRINNGYRVFHYTGKLLSQKCHDKEELWQVSWKPSLRYNFQVQELTPAEKKAAANITFTSATSAQQHPADKLPAGAITRQGAYVPPHLRKEGAKPGGLGVAHMAPSSAPQLTIKEKKIKKVQSKLDEIRKLKNRESSGDKLETNQLKKIQSEQKLQDELGALMLSED